jgi:anti-sigma regulatory factor (Ser/Thr protein kinase)
VPQPSRGAATWQHGASEVALPDEVRCVGDGRPVFDAALTGELSLAGTAQVRRFLLKALAAGPDVIMIDMRELRSARDIYLTVFAAVARTAAAWPGCRLLLYGPSAPVSAALTAMRISEYVTVCGTRAEALALSAEPFTAHRVSESFPPQPASIGQARRLCAQACADWGADERQTDDVRQIVSELASNAVRHAGTDFLVTFRATRHHLHVSVRDGSSMMIRMLPEGMSRAGGRGLRIVELLAVVWGCSPTSDGKVVWASVRRQRP